MEKEEEGVKIHVKGGRGWQKINVRADAAGVKGSDGGGIK